MRSINPLISISLASVLIATDCLADNYEINTFLNVGASSTNIDGEYLQSITKDAAYEYDTSYGVNLRTQLASNVSGVAQLTGSGRKDGNYDVQVEWAFVEYYLSQAWRLRIGKMNLQTFTLSDYIEVGYLYPWVRPPEEVYGFNPMRNYPGLEIMHTAHWGKDVNFTSMFFTGSAKVQISDVTTMHAVNGYGMNFQLNAPGFMLRAGSITPRVEISQDAFVMATPGGPISMPGYHLAATNRMYLTTVGFSWDIQGFVGYGEWIKTTPQGELHEVFPNQTGSYLTVGYKFSNLMPFVSVGNADADPFTGVLTQGVFQPNPAIAQSSVSLGLRYEVNDFSAVKFEVKNVDPKLIPINMNFVGYAGPCPQNPNEAVGVGQCQITPNAGFLFTGANPATDQNYTLVSMSYNMIF